MAFKNIFKDNNDINEKKCNWVYVICCYGRLSLVVDLVTGYLRKRFSYK